MKKRTRPAGEQRRAAHALYMPTDATITFVMTAEQYAVLERREKGGAGTIARQLFNAVRALEPDMSGTGMTMDRRAQQGIVIVRVMVGTRNYARFRRWCEVMDKSMEEATAYALHKRYFGPRAVVRRPDEQLRIEFNTNEHGYQEKEDDDPVPGRGPGAEDRDAPAS